MSESFKIYCDETPSDFIFLRSDTASARIELEAVDFFGAFGVDIWLAPADARRAAAELIRLAREIEEQSCD